YGQLRRSAREARGRDHRARREADEEKRRRAARDQAGHSARTDHGRRTGLRLSRREGQGDQSRRQGGFLQYRPAAIPRREILQADVRAVPARNGRSTIESGSEEIVGVEPVRLCLKNACALYSVRSPPPCGEGWGVVPLLRRWRHHHLTASPPP